MLRESNTNLSPQGRSAIAGAWAVKAMGEGTSPFARESGATVRLLQTGRKSSAGTMCLPKLRGALGQGTLEMPSIAYSLLRHRAGHRGVGIYLGMRTRQTKINLGHRLLKMK